MVEIDCTKKHKQPQIVYTKSCCLIISTRTISDRVSMEIARTSRRVSLSLEMGIKNGRCNQAANC